MSDSADSKISFFSRDRITCPVCEATFFREDLRTGRGRLIAGELTNELRRLYEPSAKYGEVYPLIYSIMVCPVCLFAAYPPDFQEFGSLKKEALGDGTEKRKEMISSILPDVVFLSPRTLFEGAASYLLAIICLDHMDPDHSPTIKQGISSLRCAWLFGDLHTKHMSENYDYLSKLMYRKARFFYSQAVEYDGNGKESLTEVSNLGPDLDKNYGYDGVLYIAAYLEYHYGPMDDAEKREKALESAKRIVGRLFGMGKASKSKPSAMLEKAKSLHSSIRKELQEDEADE